MPFVDSIELPEVFNLKFIFEQFEGNIRNIFKIRETFKITKLLC